MIETKNKDSERAILIALNTKDISREVVEEHLNELEELARTAGAETILKIIQNRYSTDPAYYLGKGKVEELVSIVELNNIDLLIFDDDLSPVQVRNLERLVNKKIIDRSGLILDIFASRAKTREAKTQVELRSFNIYSPALQGHGLISQSNMAELAQKVPAKRKLKQIEESFATGSAI